MAKVTINEGLDLLKVISARIAELKDLRTENANTRTRLYGEMDQKQIVEPVYDVRALDRLVNQLSAQKRRLSAAIKAMNAKTEVDGFDWDDSLLGEIELKT